MRGDRLVLVGGSAEARKLAATSTGARVIDARGRMLVGTAAAAGADAPGATWRVPVMDALAPGAAASDAVAGTLAVGHGADFVVVDRDLTRPGPAEGDARVLLAVVGGRVVHEVADDAPR